MTEQMSVKIAKVAPAGATAVGEGVHSDRMTKVPGVRRAVMERSGFAGAVGQTMVLNDGEQTRVLMGLGPSSSTGADELRTAAAVFARAVPRDRRIAVQYPEALDLRPGGRCPCDHRGPDPGCLPVRLLQVGGRSRCSLRDHCGG